MQGPRRFIAAAGIALLACSCAHVSPTEPRPSVDAELVGTDHEALRLSELRGQPLLLFFFSTFDNGSQLALGALMRARTRMDASIQVVGVALQPNPLPFLPSYANALAVDFPLTHEPAGDFIAGRSALGGPITVPSLALLSPDGKLVQLLVGVPTEEDVVELTEAIGDP